MLYSERSTPVQSSMNHSSMFPACASMCQSPRLTNAHTHRTNSFAQRTKQVKRPEMITASIDESCKPALCSHLARGVDWESWQCRMWPLEKQRPGRESTSLGKPNGQYPSWSSGASSLNKTLLRAIIPGFIWGKVLRDLNEVFQAYM